jgi:molybdenum cofactor biosynthesis protein B
MIKRGVIQMSKTVEEHRASAPKELTFAILTISTSRMKQLTEGVAVKDQSGDAAKKLLEEAGHKVGFRRIISDDKTSIVDAMKALIAVEELEVIITCGGTGVAKSDVTIETVEPMFAKTLPGFGELMRKISYSTIGSAAMLTRAIGGIIGDKVIFCIPGSTQAVEVALEKLIIPEIGHVVKHAREN